jgi:uncharacterized protein YjbI with pentapeptide repeats
METLCAYVRENAVQEGPKFFPPGNTETLRMQNVLRSDIRTAFQVIENRSQARIKFELSKGFRLNFRYANFQFADLRGSKFRNSDFEHARFEFSDLRAATLTGSNLDRANFSYATLHDADLTSVQAENAFFSYAGMSGTTLRNSMMQGSSFEKTNLTNADLHATDLFGANFSDAVLTNSNFDKAELSVATFKFASASGADFRESKGLDSEKLREFFGCVNTKIPESLEVSRPEEWSRKALALYGELNDSYQTWRDQKQTP